MFEQTNIRKKNIPTQQKNHNIFLAIGIVTPWALQMLSKKRSVIDNVTGILYSLSEYGLPQSAQTARPVFGDI